MKNLNYIYYLIFACSLFFTIISCKEEETPGTIPDDGSPKISFINPIQGKIDDTVTIYGKNFSSVIEENVVKLGGMTMQVIEASEGKVLAKVPAKSVSSKISLTVNNKTVQTEEYQVKYNAPIITKIEPVTVKPGDTVIIKGEDFSEEIGFNKVTFGLVQGVVTSASKTELKVIVPDVAYKVEVKVNSNSIPANMVYYSVIPVPSITSIRPTSASPGMNISINGSRFDEGFNLKVNFNNQILPITGMSSGPSGPYALHVKIPDNAVSGNMTVTATTGFDISPQLKIVSKPTIIFPAIKSGAIGSEITIEGTDLAVFGEDGVQVWFGNYLGKITSLTNTSVKAQIPSNAISGEGDLKVIIYGYSMPAGKFTIN